MAFKIGERVTLKSGGPSMTVDTVKSDGDLYCVWFNQSDRTWEIKGHSFKQETLRSIDQG
ncbi:MULTISPECIES: YodC family protein [unclassified Rhizobium]|uniref:YodC family protein n=1 Tax=unclassified Rhizobium TaxID=2613769 RepID=UPI003816F38B